MAACYFYLSYWSDLGSVIVILKTVIGGYIYEQLATIIFADKILTLQIGQIQWTGSATKFNLFSHKRAETDINIQTNAHS